MYARDHETATNQARAHVQLAADLLGSSQRKGYEQEGRFYITQKELVDYDMGRAYRAALDPIRYGHEAHLEKKISMRALKSGAARDGVGMFVPFAVLQRDLNMGTPSGGGSLAGSRSSNDPSIWLRPLSVCAAAGATFLSGLTGDLNLPRFASGSEAAVSSEQGEATAFDPSFGQVVMSPKRITALTSYSRKLGLMMNSDVGAMLSADLGAAIAQRLDAMAINGSGTENEPLGILNTPNIGSVAIGVNGGAVTWDDLCELEFKVDVADAAVGALGYATTKEVKKLLRKTEQFTGNGCSIWNRNAEGDNIAGVPAFASSNVPGNLVKGSSNNCSAIIFGNWPDVIIGVWGDGVELILDKYSNGASAAGSTRVVATMYVDVALRRPSSFAAIRDAVAP